MLSIRGWKTTQSTLMSRLMRNRRRRPAAVTNYRNGPNTLENHQNLMNWDLVEMMKKVRSDDFKSFAEYARKNAGWSEEKIKDTWRSVHGFNALLVQEDVD